MLLIGHTHAVAPSTTAAIADTPVPERRALRGAAATSAVVHRVVLPMVDDAADTRQKAKEQTQQENDPPHANLLDTVA